MLATIFSLYSLRCVISALCLLTFRNIPDRGDKADNGAFLIHQR